MTSAPRRTRASRAYPLSPAEARESVAAAIGSLEGSDRILLALCLLEGLSTLEAGAATRLPSRVVDERLADLLRHLAGRARAAARGSRRAA